MTFLRGLNDAGIDWATIEEEFARLTAEWKKETAHYSKVSQVAQHHAYRRIIEMGDCVVPLILQDLKEHGGRWFPALREITKTNPATPEIRGKMEETKAAWLKWGTAHG